MANLGFHCQQLDHIQERLLAHGLARGEFYNFPPQELPALKRLIRGHGLAASVHCPLARLDWYPQPPTWAFLCDGDAGRRELNLRMIRDTLGRAGEMGAEYVVAHFPSPDSTGAAPDIREWEDILWGSAQSLASLSREYDIPIHIEGFGPCPFLESGFLARVLTRFPELRYCFDSGHMGLAARRDGFDLYRFAREMAPLVGSVHLWNARDMQDYLDFRHIPVHPSQRPEEGWVDVARLLPLLRQAHTPVPVILESPFHYPPELGDLDCRDSIAWVKKLLET